MQLVLVIGVLILTCAALTNSASFNYGQSRVVRVLGGSETIISNRDQDGHRHSGSGYRRNNVNRMREFREGRRSYPTRSYVNDHDDDDDFDVESDDNQVYRPRSRYPGYDHDNHYYGHPVIPRSYRRRRTH